jgi:hypothetical protein
MKKIYLTATVLFLTIMVSYSQKDTTNLDSAKIKIILTNLVTSTSNPNNYSPELAPISPNAASFGKFGVIDINPSTGLLNNSIKVFG